jgi:two-component system response regulator AtoC
MKEIRERIGRIADSNVPVLIRGESGTGKEIFARLIHQRSSYQSGPFVKVHCPAVPGTLFESELFGHEAGSFTGASQTKLGRVEAAQGGSLFLDEIGDLDIGLQAKLLHFLQDGQVDRIGGQEAKSVNVRVLCATHCPIESEIEGGKFRTDLFFRINVFTLHLPSLRERKVDIPDLADYFLRLYNNRYNRQAPPLSDACILRLQEYDWPGNLRELENLMIAHVVLGPEEGLLTELRTKHTFLPWRAAESEGPVSLRKIARQAALQAQRRAILRGLEANKWSRKKTARAFNISYRTLLTRIKEVGIPSKRSMHGGTCSVPSRVN